jgi:hypothetical protein
MKAILRMVLLRVAPVLSLLVLISLPARAEENSQPGLVQNLAPDGPADPSVLHQLLKAVASKTSRTPLNLTGDDGTYAFVVPSGANVAGLNGAFYETELKIMTRWQSSGISVVMCVVPNGPPPTGGLYGTGRSCTYHTLTGYNVYVWSNILATLGYSGAGYLVIGINPSQPNQTAYTMSAWANTYTASPIGGYYRTSLPIFGNVDNAGPGLSGNLNQDASTRNNIYVSNLDTTYSANVYLYPSQNGAPWGTPFVVTLAPGEAEQYSLANIFPSYSGAGISIQFAATGLASAGIGYVIRTDNYTNDGMIELPTYLNYNSWPY